MSGDKPYPKLFIQHIPKTATTSLIEACRKIYGEKNVQRLLIPNDSPMGIYIRDPESAWHTDRDRFVADAWDTISDSIAWDVPVLHGHHPYEIIQPLVRIGEGRKLITWVRDPISLAMSWFLWDKSNVKRVEKTPLTIQKYLEEGVRNNILTQMLGWAVDYDFIGFKEWIKEDWTVLCHKYGFPATELPRKNVQPLNYDRQISANHDQIRLIAKHNQEDMALYGDLVGGRFKEKKEVYR